MAKKKSTPSAKATPKPQAEKSGAKEVVEAGLITKEQAKKLADDHLLPKDDRYVNATSNTGKKFLKDKCNPTYVTADGMVFHSDFEGEANAHCKKKGLKMFVVNYNK